MSKAFIIQARLSSTRLPNKILLPFYQSKSILDLLIDKLLSFPDYKIILATSINKENDLLEEIANKRNILCFRGSENDVLQRFIDAAKYFGVTDVIRICSDNPFLEVESLKELVECDKRGVDYVSFKIDGIPSIKTHFGFWAEYVTLAALEKVMNLTSDNLYHEHVTNYIYAHDDLFVLKWISTSSILEGRKDIRTTIDTKEDFCVVQQMYETLKGTGKLKIEDVVDYLDKNPLYLNSMKQQIIENSK